MRIRPARAGDLEAIERIHRAAFAGPVEARLVARLCAEGDAVLSLLAEAGEALGHVLFSRLAAPFPALALAPLAVMPGHRRSGIGSALVRQGLAEAEQAGWRGVFVLGEPAFYCRFGFDAALAAGFATPYDGPHLMLRPLGGDLPARAGRIGYAPAFDDLA
jgi:putative acetyltransferase